MAEFLDHDWRFTTSGAADGASGLRAIATCAACGLVDFRVLTEGETTSPSLPTSCAARPKPPLRARGWRLLKETPALVTLCAGLLGLVVVSYTVNPNFGPTTARSIQVTDIAIE